LARRGRATPAQARLGRIGSGHGAVGRALPRPGASAATATARPRGGSEPGDDGPGRAQVPAREPGGPRPRLRRAQSGALATRAALGAAGTASGRRGLSRGGERAVPGSRARPLDGARARPLDGARAQPLAGCTGAASSRWRARPRGRRVGARLARSRRLPVVQWPRPGPGGLAAVVARRRAAPANGHGRGPDGTQPCAGARERPPVTMRTRPHAGRAGSRPPPTAAVGSPGRGPPRQAGGPCARAQQPCADRGLEARVQVLSSSMQPQRHAVPAATLAAGIHCVGTALTDASLSGTGGAGLQPRRGSANATQ
jgi:hypothetical protein